MAKHLSTPPPRPPKPPGSIATTSTACEQLRNRFRNEALTGREKVSGGVENNFNGNNYRFGQSNVIPMSVPPQASKETETALPPLQPRQLHQVPPPLPPATSPVTTFAVFSGSHTHSPPSTQPHEQLQSNNIDNNIANHHNNNININSNTISNSSRFGQSNVISPAPSPITIPLTSSSFSRRRPPPPGSALPIISSLTSSTLSPQSNNSQHLDTQISPVTLAAPRPETERLANEYVDTPFRTPRSVSRLQHGVHSTHTNIVATHHSTPSNHNGERTGSISGDKISTSPNTTNTVTSVTPIDSKTHSVHPFVGHTQNAAVSTTTIDGKCHHKTSDIPAATRANLNRCERANVLPIAAITKQPLPFSKDSSTAALHEDIDVHPINGESLNSITCPQCKRCRCEECQRPRQLPSRWICDNTCLCSAETIIDYTSCLCCVKALFYHCSKDHEIECEGDSISCADDPCSCLPHKRTQRWAWLSALSLALPCLWFYWPMRGCVAICAKCYARHSRHGCRCPVQNSNKSTINNISGSNSGTNSARTINRTGDLTPEKRLLDSSPEF